MSIAQIGEHGCSCMHEVMRHRLRNNGSEEGLPSEGKSEAKRIGFASRMAAHMVNEMDTDGDKSLSPDETALSVDAFNEIDGDGDGMITRAEIANGLRDRREAVAMELGLERPEEPPQGDERPPRPRARMRQAVAAYEGSMSDLMANVFETSVENTVASETTTTQEVVDVAV